MRLFDRSSSTLACFIWLVSLWACFLCISYFHGGGLWPTGYIIPDMRLVVGALVTQMTQGDRSAGGGGDQSLPAQVPGDDQHPGLRRQVPGCGGRREAGETGRWRDLKRSVALLLVMLLSCECTAIALPKQHVIM